MDQLLDVSSLAPPEPMERVLDALATLPDGDRLRVLLPREPYPLYDLLRRMGYAWETEPAAGRFQILIWSTASAPTRGRPVC